MNSRNNAVFPWTPLLAAAALVSAAVIFFPSAALPEHLAPLKYAFPFPDLFRMMPGAAMGAHLSGTAAVPLLRAVIAFLCFDSARRISGTRAGLAAAVLSLFFGSDGEQLLFSLLLLTLLDNCLRRQGAEGMTGAAGSGAVLAAAFLMRSTALPMAAACAAHEFFFTGGTRRERALRASTIVAVPFLFLAAWVWLSYLVLGRPVLFEADRTGYNLVSGALGAVGTIQGDYYALAGVPRDTNLFVWAAGHIAGNPLTYLKGVFGRAAFFLAEHPLLSLAAAAGAVMAVRKRAAALAAAFASVFLLSIFLFSVESRYFTPALFFLSILAGNLAGSRKAPVKERRAADTALAVLVSAVFLWAVYLDAALVRAAAAMRPLGEAAAAEAARGTAGPRLLELAAEEAFSARDTMKGRELLGKAAAAGSEKAAKLLEIIVGRGDAELISETERENLLAPMLLRALELGGPEAAGARLAELRDWVRYTRSSDPAVRARLAEAASRRPLEPALLSALRYWPEEKHRPVLARLSRLHPLRGELALKFLFSPQGNGEQEAVFWSEGGDGPARGAGDAFVSALLAAREGGRSAAERSAASDAALFSGSREGRSLLLRAGVIAGSGEMTAAAGGPGGGACAALEHLRKTEGGDPVFAEIAWRQAALGLRGNAAASAECGLRAGLSDRETLILAVALQDAGKPGRASEIMDSLSAADPADPVYPAYAGIARMLAGDRDGAVKRFKAALAADPGNRTALEGLKAASREDRKGR